MVMPLVKTVNVPAPAQPQQEPMNVVEGPVQPEVAPAPAPAPAPVAEPAPAPAPVEVPVVAPAPVVEEPSEPQEISDRVAYARKLKEKWIAAAKRQD